MVRPVPELCFWWAISQSCLGLLRLLGLLQGPGPADLFSGFAVSQSTSVSEPMPPFNLTNWRTDSHIRRVEAGKMVRPVPELCIWWAISLLCLWLLRSDVLTPEPLSSVFFTELVYSSSFIFFTDGLPFFFYSDGIQMYSSSFLITARTNLLFFLMTSYSMGYKKRAHRPNFTKSCLDHGARPCNELSRGASKSCVYPSGD